MNQNTTNNYISKSVNIAQTIDEALKTIDFKIGNTGSLISSTEEIISLLFDSILTGEFIIDTNYGSLDSYIEDMDILPVENILANGNISDSTKLNIETFKERIAQLKDIIYLYTRFVKDIKIILSNQEKDAIITSSYRYQSINEDYIIGLFFLNIRLCSLDIHFNESQYCFDKISSIKDDISSIETNSELRFLKNQVTKIKKKATFLLFKWCKRAKVSGISLYIDKGVESYETELNKYGNNWNSIIKYINNHYYNDKDNNKKYFERELKKSFSKIENKKFEEFSCQDIHLYIKYNKDITKNIEKLDKLNIFLEEWKDNSENEYEKNIRETIYNYSLNNRFSLFIETCLNKDDLYSEYQKIYTKNNKNYFLQYKLIYKSIELINKELNENPYSTNFHKIEEIEKFLIKIEPDYEIYKTNIEWVLKHVYFIYRVTLKECIVDGIFIYSSFLLPLDNRESKEGFEKISIGFRNLKNQLPLLKKISLFKDKLLQFDEKIEKRDTKTIELMGLFTAIIAFVMGSIPTFQYLENIFDVGIFFIIFASSLISFLLVLLFVTGRIKENIKLKHIVIFYPTMIIFTIILSYFNPKNTTLQQTEKTVIEENTSDKTIDTLKQSKITKKQTTSTKDSLK